MATDGRLQRAFALAALAALTPCGAAVAAPGDLDPTFGTGGVTRSAIGESRSSISVMTSTDDGKLVVGGLAVPLPPPSERQEIAIARYSADGVLDTTFGTGGAFVIPDQGQWTYGMLDRGTDGTFTFAGHWRQGYTYPLLVRMTSGGALDTAFAGTGMVQLPVENAEATKVAHQPDGKLLFAWQVRTMDGSGYFVSRRNANGTADTTFGSDGTIQVPAHSDIDLAAGGAIHGASIAQDRRSVTTWTVGADGRPVTSTTAELPAGAWADMTQRLPDGTRLVFGYGQELVDGANKRKAVFRRLTAAGALDPAFGSHPPETAAGLFRGQRAAVDAAGRYVVVGSADGERSMTAAMRFLPDGTVDESFGQDGLVTVPLPADAPFGVMGWATDVLVQPSGRIVLAGTSAGSRQTMMTLVGLEGEAPEGPPSDGGEPPADGNDEEHHPAPDQGPSGSSRTTQTAGDATSAGDTARQGVAAPASPSLGAPAAKRPTASARLAGRSARTVRVVLSWPKTWRGWLTVRVSSAGKKRAVVGRRRVRITRAGRATVSVALNRAGRRLSRRAKLRVSVQRVR